MVETLKKPDRYGGIVLTSDELPETFPEMLPSLIENWKSEKVRSVQIHFKPPKCHMMDCAAQHGFYFHHAHQKEGYVLMILWLDEKVPCRFPHYAHHYVGVGGAMVNEKRQIMLIKENRSLDARKWKLPGGFMDPKESLRQAVEREVKEETGVVAQFEAVCAMREMTDYKFDQASDFYFVAICAPLETNGEIQDVTEVQKAEWIDLEKITDVNDENSEVFLFPTAYMYVCLIKKQLAGLKPGQTISDRLKEVNWPWSNGDGQGYNSMTGEPAKFNFYMPNL